MSQQLQLSGINKSEIHNFTNREKIPVQFSSENLPSNIPSNISICTFRVIQEGLRNIAKHSETQQAWVKIRCNSNTLMFAIRDDGKGFDYDKEKRNVGLGLASMQERMRLVGGTISIFSLPGKGCMIEAKIVLPDDKNVS